MTDRSEPISQTTGSRAAEPEPLDWHAVTDALILTGANLVIGLATWRAVRHFYRIHGRIPKVAVPDTYAERMLWRKLVDHNPLFIELTDKLACKDYVARRCPDLAIPETLWVGDDADDIPDALLRGDVFVKTNHSCKQNYAIRDGVVDRAHLKATTDAWLASVYGRSDFEWAYGGVKPRLFVERSVGDADLDLLEFSVRASDGRPLLGSVTGHNDRPHRWVVYLDVEGRPTARPTGEADAQPAPLPEGLAIERPYREAVAHTVHLSRGIDYARFDFMWNGDTLYAGEITIYPNAGNVEIDDPGVRRLVLGGWRLEASDFLSRPGKGLSGLYADALRRRLRRRTYV